MKSQLITSTLSSMNKNLSPAFWDYSSIIVVVSFWMSGDVWPLTFWHIAGQAGPFLYSVWLDPIYISISFSYRALGEHGFLVEGSLTTSKKEAVSESIPYKYLVYKNKKQEYEFEYIYKLDSSHHTTNRCLFVKPNLINEDGNYFHAIKVSLYWFFICWLY